MGAHKVHIGSVLGKALGAPLMRSGVNASMRVTSRRDGVTTHPDLVRDSGEIISSSDHATHKRGQAVHATHERSQAVQVCGVCALSRRAPLYSVEYETSADVRQVRSS